MSYGKYIPDGWYEESKSFWEQQEYLQLERYEEVPLLNREISLIREVENLREESWKQKAEIERLQQFTNKLQNLLQEGESVRNKYKLFFVLMAASNPKEKVIEASKQAGFDMEDK